MRIKVVIHEAQEGGFWAEVPGLPGCYSQGETLDETVANIREAIECHLDRAVTALPSKSRVQEVEV